MESMGELLYAAHIISGPGINERAFMRITSFNCGKDRNCVDGDYGIGVHNFKEKKVDENKIVWQLPFWIVLNPC